MSRSRARRCDSSGGGARSCWHARAVAAAGVASSCAQRRVVVARASSSRVRQTCKEARAICMQTSRRALGGSARRRGTHVGRVHTRPRSLGQMHANVASNRNSRHLRASVASNGVPRRLHASPLAVTELPLSAVAPRAAVSGMAGGSQKLVRGLSASEREQRAA